MSMNTSVRIPEDVLEQYDRVARATGVSRNKLIGDALREAIAPAAWFVAAVERGWASARRGDFVPDEEMEAFWDEWCGDADPV
jgi:predicted transcriptional regulator